MVSARQKLFPLSVGRWRFLLLIFIASFFIRFIYVLTLEGELFFPDEESYVQLASNFLAGRGLVTDSGALVSRPPLYPLFLAGCFKIFGPSVLAIRIIHAFVGALVPLAVYYLGRRVFGEWEGIIACCVAAFFNPFYVFYTGLVLTETIFILVIVVVMHILHSLYTERRWAKLFGRSILAGLSLAALTLMRSSFFLFLPFAVPFWLILSRRRRCALVAVCVTGIFFAAGLFPWAYRNKRLTGHWVFTTLMAGRSLYEACGPDADGGPAMHKTEWPEEIEGRSEYDEDRILKERAIEYIKEHPLRTVRLALIKFKRFWNIIPNYEHYRKPLYMVVSIVTYCPVLLLGALGVFEARRQIRNHIFLLLPVLYFTLMHMIFVGSIRYREPIMAYLAILAAHFLLIRHSKRYDWLSHAHKLDSR